MAEIQIERTPIMYKTQILRKRMVFLFWLFGVFASGFGYYYHERPSRIWLLAFLPQHLIQLIILLLAHLMAKLTHHSIYSLFSLDLSQGKYVDLDPRRDKSILRSDLEDLFVSPDKFDEYQKRVYGSLVKKRRDILSIFLGFGILTLIHLSDRMFGGTIAQLGSKPYPVDESDFVMTLASIIQILCVGIPMIGFMNAFLLLGVFVQASNELGDNQNISWDYLINPDQINSEEVSLQDASLQYYRVSQITQYSLKRFKRKCNSIPQRVLPINIIITIMITVAGGGILYYINLRGGNDVLQGITIVVLVAFLLLNLYMFFVPQLSLHGTIKVRKEKTIDVLEEHYERKKLEWLSMSPDSTHEQRQALFNELQVLANFIEEIENMLTWPFNYKQLVTVFISGFVGLLFLVDVFNFIEALNTIKPIE